MKKITPYGLIIILIFIAGCNVQNQSNPTQSKQVRMQINPVQCLGNPWERDWLNSHSNDYNLYKNSNEFDVIKDYYKKQGIVIFDVRKERTMEIVCDACSCPRGDTIYVSISDSDAGKMLNLGFKMSK